MEKIKNILDLDYKSVIYIAGGGTQAIPALLENGGGSAFLLESIVPYSTKAFDDVLAESQLKIHQGVEKYVSTRASAKLAIAAYFKGKTLTNEPIIGIGASAKLSTGEGEREGREHSLCVSFCVGPYISTNFEIKLNHSRSRLTEEVFCAKLIVELLHALFVEQTSLKDIVKSLNLHEDDELIVTVFCKMNENEFEKELEHETASF